VANARNAGLPTSVRSWIAAWVPRKQGQSAALVALLDFTGEEGQEVTEARALLKNAAASAEIDFLPREIQLSDLPLTRAVENQPVNAPAAASIPPDTRTPTVEGWGIND